MNNEKILALIKERLDFIFDFADRKEDYEEYSIDAWNALAYISGLIAMVDGCGDEDNNKSTEDENKTPSEKLIEVKDLFATQKYM